MTVQLPLLELEEKCLWVRRKVLDMAVKANSGHVSTAMSQTEILVTLYFGGGLKYDPANPTWDERDYFLLSKGQGGIGLYPILAAAGFFPESDLDNFCGEGSHIGVHAEWHCPGIEMISGSLGHGLSIGTGIAQSLKSEGKDSLVYVLTGDGELHEGSNWEALMSASWFGLDNLVMIVDRNGQLTLGKTDDRQTAKDGVGLDPLREKMESFGFEVWEVDGHNLGDLVLTLFTVKNNINKQKQPMCIIANTKKGKGLSCMEDKRLWHYRVPTGRDLEQCWDDLKVPAEARPVPGDSQVVHSKGMRDCFFDALYERFKQDKKLVLITADNGFAAIEKWAESLPDQVFQVGIAEQQAVGMAAGMALRGYKPFVYAIAPFVSTRIHEFVKLDACAMNLPICFVGIGAGYAYSIMGPTHHNAEDIAIMRALPNMHIFSPADGSTASNIASHVANLKSPSYVRLDRGGMEDLYDASIYSWESGIRQVRLGGRVMILATGVMTHKAIEAAKQLEDDPNMPGAIRVLDIFKLKPFDTERLLSFCRDVDHVVTIEEHRLSGGLGSIISEVFIDQSIHLPLLRLGAEDRFVFELGGREVIHKNMGLDTVSIVKRIREWVNV